ncbi:MAG: hypothetical protein O7H41_13505 [Planctomycetota bacterium]|nr:hypothetical protein [Planctomycetota bacterium]
MNGKSTLPISVMLLVSTSVLFACGQSDTVKSTPALTPDDVVRYMGAPSDVTTVYPGEWGPTYESSMQVMLSIKVGMTVWEVSEILKADFSPTRGIWFDYYRADTYLAVMFQDGRVAARRFGHNGNCLDYRG